MDNAPNNGVCLRNLGLKLQKKNPRIFSEHYQIRCVCHILHLAAGDMASKKHVDFEQNMLDQEGNQSADPLEGFDANDSLAHLFNYAKKVHSSSFYHDEFKQLCGGVTLPQANKTRWISWSRTITRALRLKLKMDHFQEVKEFPTACYITEDDWTRLGFVGLFPPFVLIPFLANAFLDAGIF
jgi:hypothetical protein